MVRNIEIQIKAREVAPVQLLDFLDFEMRKNHSPFGMIGERQGIETLRKHILVADFLWAQGCELLPGCPFRHLDANTFLQRFIASYHHPPPTPLAHHLPPPDHTPLPPLHSPLSSLLPPL